MKFISSKIYKWVINKEVMLFRDVDFKEEWYLKLIDKVLKFYVCIISKIVVLGKIKKLELFSVFFWVVYFIFYGGIC